MTPTPAASLCPCATTHLPGRLVEIERLLRVHAPGGRVGRAQRNGTEAADTRFAFVVGHDP
jgi:hypothetical protein